MPRGDGTGPMGMGPMTGRAMGYCAGYSAPGYMNPAGFGFAGRGFGFAGRGRGNRNMFYATGMPGWMRAGSYPGYGYPAVPAAPQYSKENEVQFLKSQAEYLRTTLEDINNRLSELEKQE
jgi:hypothetical protein